jgi:hypothetical protein
MFSASSEARDRNAPTNANQIRLQTSRIRQEHRPIRYQLPARLSFRQGHQSLVKFSESEASNHTPSLVDFTTTTPELKFSVLTWVVMTLSQKTD